MDSETAVSVEFTRNADDFGPFGGILYPTSITQQSQNRKSSRASTNYTFITEGGSSSDRGSFGSRGSNVGLGGGDDETRRWDEEYQDALSSHDRAGVVSIYDEFKVEAVALVRILVEERMSGGRRIGHVPLTADPPTYCMKGMYVVLATGDKTRSFYGCTENAAKVLSNEIRSVRVLTRDVINHNERRNISLTDTYASSMNTQHLLAQIAGATTNSPHHHLPDLCLPLSVLVKHLGFTALVSACMPIDRATKVCGYNALRNDDFLVPALGTQVSTVMSSLSRRTRVVGKYVSKFHENVQSAAASYPASITTSVYTTMTATYPSRLYILETGRMYGAMDSSQDVLFKGLLSKGVSGSGDRYSGRYVRTNHYRLLRPEAVQSQTDMVISDGFGASDTPEGNEQLTQLTASLLRHGIPTFASQLLSMPAFMAKEVTSDNFVQRMHAAGLNLRYMGLLLQAVLQQAHLLVLGSNGDHLAPTLFTGFLGGEATPLQTSPKNAPLGRKQSLTLPKIRQTASTASNYGPPPPDVELPEHILHIIHIIRIEILARSCKSLLFDKFRTLEVGGTETVEKDKTSSSLPTLNPTSRVKFDGTPRKSKITTTTESPAVVGDASGSKTRTRKATMRDGAPSSPQQTTGARLVHYLNLMANSSQGGSAGHQINAPNVAGSDSKRVDTILTPRPPSGYCRDAYQRVQETSNWNNDPLWSHKLVAASMFTKLFGVAEVDVKYWSQSLIPEAQLKFHCTDHIHDLLRVPRRMLVERAARVCGIEVIADFPEDDKSVQQKITVRPSDITIYTLVKDPTNNHGSLKFFDNNTSQTNPLMTMTMGLSQRHVMDLENSEELEKRCLLDLKAEPARDSEGHMNVLKRLISLYSLWGSVRAPQLAIVRKMLQYSKRLQFEKQLTELWKRHQLDGIVTGPCGVCGSIINMSNYNYHANSGECNPKQLKHWNQQLPAVTTTQYGKSAKDSMKSACMTSISGLSGAYPVGLEDVIIPNEAFRASSSMEGCEPYQARLHLPCPNHWRPLVSDNTQWISVDLGNVKLVTALATEGSAGVKAYVQAYRLYHSLDGETWTQYLGPYIHYNVQKGVSSRVFPGDPSSAVCTREGKPSRGTMHGNQSPTDTVRNTFLQPFSARYVKINPFDPDFMMKPISLQLEVYTRSDIIALDTAMHSLHRDKVPLCHVDWSTVLDHKSALTRWDLAQQEVALWKDIDAIESGLGDRATNRILAELTRLYNQLILMYSRWDPERRGDLIIVRKRFIDVMVMNIRAVKDKPVGRLRAMEFARSLPSMVFALGTDGDHRAVVKTVENVLLELDAEDVLLEFYSNGVQYYGSRNPVVIPMVARLATNLLKSGRNSECLDLYKTVLDPAFLAHAEKCGSLTTNPMPPRTAHEQEDFLPMFGPHHPHSRDIKTSLYGAAFRQLARLHKKIQTVVENHTVVDTETPWENVAFIDRMYAKRRDSLDGDQEEEQPNENAVQGGEKDKDTL
eukprot:PhF_6_TR26633/c0_g1_i1/m.38549